MIVFLTLLLIVLIIGRVAAGFFAHAVPFLGAIATPLIVICVIVGLILAVFVGIEIYTEIRGKK